MHSLISVLCLLTTLMGVALGWYNKFDNSVYGGWTADRRSPRRMCRPNIGQHCLISSQCCGDVPICRRGDESVYGFGVCADLADRSGDQYNYFGNGEGSNKVGTKKTNEECVDSFECADQCCRLIKLGRLGKKLTCGKPRGYRCVGRQTNDVYGNY